MHENTCAACDCELDANAIKVTNGGQVVEVCCEECALKLRKRSPRGKSRAGLIDEHHLPFHNHTDD